MSKHSINIARICASLILGFTHLSFAATEEPAMLDIPPPPILKNPATGGAQTNATYNTGNNAAPAAVGTSKASGNESAKTTGLFSKGNGVSATSTQSDNANAVNAATEAARRAAIPSAPTGVMWINQVFPAANTMYSQPQRK